MNNEDKIIQKLIEMDAKLDETVTKGELRVMEDRLQTRFDQQSVILKTHEEERLFMIERVRRIEDEVARVKARLLIA